MMEILTWFQVDVSDIRTLVTQLPIVAICLLIVYYFDNKNDKKDERFRLFMKDMQNDWQDWLKDEREKQTVLMKEMQDVIGKHTETLNASIGSKNTLIRVIEREWMQRQGAAK